MSLKTPTPKLFPEPEPFRYGKGLGSLHNDPLRARAVWVENVVPSSSALPSGSSLSPSIPRRRIFFALCVISLAGALLAGRLFYLQIIRGGDLFAMAEKNRIRSIPEAAERGVIYDRAHRPLVRNIPNFSLVIDPGRIPTDPEGREHFFRALKDGGISQGEIEEKLQLFAPYNFRTIALKDTVDYDAAIRMTIASADLPGVEVLPGARREYLFDSENVIPQRALPDIPLLAGLSSVLGYVGRISKEELDAAGARGYSTNDFIGKTGIELSKEELLRGIAGAREIEVNVRGEAQHVVREQKPIPGFGVVLGIDKNLQIVAERALASAMAGSRAKGGAVVALDPRNGEIRALVNLPTFDSNAFSRGISSEDFAKLLDSPQKPLFARAWAGAFPSGSTIKPVIAALALGEGIITRNTTVRSAGGIQVAQWFFPDWKAGGHGPTNVIKAIAESVNTFFYIVGGGYHEKEGLGVSRLASGLAQFGFGKKNGIDLPGEAAGFIPTPAWKQEKKGEQWYIGDTYNLSIGQGDLLVSPLQIAVATAAVANNGTLYAPRVVAGLIDPSTGVETPQNATVITSSVSSADALSIVREGMRAAVVSGSARRLSALPIMVAGKTGTAQWSKIHPTHAWFTGFAPYQNPDLVVTIFLEEGGDGSSAAVPVAEKIFYWWAKNRER